MSDKIDRFKGDAYFLSNFYRADVRMAGLVFPTSEHAFQALKTMDFEQRAWIAEAPTPSMAKLRGRKARLVHDWDSIKVRVMADVLLAKFSDQRLADKLVATYPKELIEGNTWHDQYWGDCWCDHCPTPGRNMLGKLLMELRDKLRSYGED